MPNSFGDQFIRPAAGGMVVQDVHDENFLRFIIPRHGFDRLANAGGVTRDDPPADRHLIGQQPSSSRKRRARSTVGTGIDCPRNSRVIIMRKLNESRSASSSVSAQMAQDATALRGEGVCRR